MKRMWMLLVAGALAVSVATVGHVRAEDPEPKTVTGTIELFNGRDLTNWYVFLKGQGRDQDKDKVFTVHDGMIHVSGNGFGCITTNEAFKNYRVVVEFKWGEKTWGNRVDRTRDSGLLVHSVGADGAFGKTWMHSIEANIIQGGVGDFIVVGDGTDAFQITSEVAPQKSAKGAYIWQKGGKPTVVTRGRVDWFGRDPNWEDKLNFRGREDVERPCGEWNTLEIVADGAKLDVYVNGTLVNQAKDVKPCGGKIQLQTEQAEIFFRRVTLMPLGK